MSSQSDKASRHLGLTDGSHIIPVQYISSDGLSSPERCFQKIRKSTLEYPAILYPPASLWPPGSVIKVPERVGISRTQCKLGLLDALSLVDLHDVRDSTRTDLSRISGILSTA